MTVKTDLERLKLKKEALEKERSQMKKRLEEELRPQEVALRKKGNELSKKTSTLAKKLQEDNRQKFEEAKQITNTAREALEEVMAQLQEIQAQIDARENDTTLYIQEQVNRMVEDFLWWAENNKEAIGYDITRSFVIAGITRTSKGSSWEYDYPTGEVGIFEKGEKSHERERAIVASYDFYFSQSCYELKNSRTTIAVQTQWYTQYLKDFTAAFLQKLEESYNLGEDLKLTIKSPEFTLELV